MNVFYPPAYGTPFSAEPTIFLAGSIEMNTATNWQERVIDDLKNHDVTLYNPRRHDWDNSWGNTTADANFVKQVNWELDHLSCADIVVFYFDPATKSPITLAELGLAIGYCKRCIVCCPDGFWRKGNVDIMCGRADITVFTTYDSWMKEIKTALEHV